MVWFQVSTTLTATFIIMAIKITTGLWLGDAFQKFTCWFINRLLNKSFKRIMSWVWSLLVNEKCILCLCTEGFKFPHYTDVRYILDLVVMLQNPLNLR